MESRERGGGAGDTEARYFPGKGRRSGPPQALLAHVRSLPAKPGLQGGRSRPVPHLHQKPQSGSLFSRHDFVLRTRGAGLASTSGGKRDRAAHARMPSFPSGASERLRRREKGAGLRMQAGSRGAHAH